MAEKILNSYETIFIIDATLDEETVTALKDKFTTLIEQNGELESVDEWYWCSLCKQVSQWLKQALQEVKTQVTLL